MSDNRGFLLAEIIDQFDYILDQMLDSIIFNTRGLVAEIVSPQIGRHHMIAPAQNW